jgi:uncharacterized coiled-coil protein SlyX
VTGDERLAELEQRVATLEAMFEALMIIEKARVRARERANGTHLRTMT